MPYTPFRTGDTRLDRNFDGLAEIVNRLFSFDSTKLNYLPGWVDQEAGVPAPAEVPGHWRTDANGDVLIQARFWNPTLVDGTASSIVFTLPPGLRPEQRVTCPIQELAQESWNLVTAFANGWVNDNTGGYDAAYMRDAAGWVHLRGGVQGGTLGLEAFTLPVGYRPPGGQQRFVVQAAGPVSDYATAIPDGRVVIFGAINTLVDLSPVTYQAMGPTHLVIDPEGNARLWNPVSSAVYVLQAKFQPFLGRNDGR